MDFGGFANIVDILGGLDIDIVDYDAANLNKEYGWDLQTGSNHINGEQALAYSRIRNVGDADYERTERQRNVLSQIISKILTLSTADQLKMVDVILPHLSTNMTKQLILRYCLTVLQKGVAGIKSYRIPQDGAFSSSVIRGMDILLPDLDKNRDLLNEYVVG